MMSFIFHACLYLRISFGILSYDRFMTLEKQIQLKKQGEKWNKHETVKVDVVRIWFLNFGKK
jgi:hypothetical protein